MRVKIYDIDDDGSERFRSVCDHSECFPDDIGEQLQALDNLRTQGRYWAGGGAAPLVLLMRAE